MRSLAAALCALSIAASAQQDPLTRFPLQVGSSWVYEHEWQSGDRNRPDVEHWRSEETITGWAKIPEGLVILRDATQQTNPDASNVTHRTIALNGEMRVADQQDSLNGAHLIALAKEPYLIQGSCVYRINNGWD